MSRLVFIIPLQKVKQRNWWASMKVERMDVVKGFEAIRERKVSTKARPISAFLLFIRCHNNHRSGASFVWLPLVITLITFVKRHVEPTEASASNPRARQTAKKPLASCNLLIARSLRARKCSRERAPLNIRLSTRTLSPENLNLCEKKISVCWKKKIFFRLRSHRPCRVAWAFSYRPLNDSDVIFLLGDLVSEHLWCKKWSEQGKSESEKWCIEAKVIAGTETDDGTRKELIKSRAERRDKLFKRIETSEL